MIAAVVLAAGSSSRMGRPKLLLPIAGKSLVRRVVEEVVASRVGQTVAVTGANRDGVAAELAGLPVELVHNPDHAEGMSTSVRTGLRALRPEVEATIVVLSDQPFVDRVVLDALVASYETSRPLVVRARYAGQPGNPVLWDRRAFGELMAQEGDQGGRTLLRQWSDQVVWCDFPDARAAKDVDTPEAYEAVRAVVEGQPSPAS